MASCAWGDCARAWLWMLVACLPLAAQNRSLQALEQVRVRQPKELDLAVTVGKNRFYAGELIPLRLTFSSSGGAYRAESRLYDRVGRMNGVEEFTVEPAGDAEDPLRGFLSAAMGMGGLSGGPAPLPYSCERVLNEWVHFRKPGTYQVAIVSRRVMRWKESAEAFAQPAGTVIEVASNVLTIEIVPAPESWVEEQIGRATEVLSKRGPFGDEDERERENAARTLRFLESPRAAAAMVESFGAAQEQASQDQASYILQMGLRTSSYRKQVLPLLEARLTAPDASIGSGYLRTLAEVAELVSAGGVPPPYPQQEDLRAAWMREQESRAHEQQKKLEMYASRLAGSLAGKTTDARLACVMGLVDLRGQLQGAGDWLLQVKPLLIRDFAALPSRAQSDLLAGQWQLIKSPAMLPLLRGIYTHPTDAMDYPRLQDGAVARIYELAPDEGRKIILAELQKPNSFLSSSTLEMLPDATLPELNETLASRIEAGQYPDQLIVRYASGEIAGRVERAYERRDRELAKQKLPRCGGILLLYFLKYDAAYGEKEIRRQMADSAPFPACYDVGLGIDSVGPRAYTPALERLAIEFLPDPKVPVKRSAAELLGKYGSAAAEKPLWESFEAFHGWWVGREKELSGPRGQEGVQLERSLRMALAQGHGWLLDAEGLTRLRSLCVSEWCKQEANEWLATIQHPVEVRLLASPEDLRVQLWQYFLKFDEMRNKVEQFPRGTRFRVGASAMSGWAEAQRRVETEIRGAGYEVVH